MKKLLSLLMCFVFLQAQTFALRGGPTSRNGVTLVQGAYSGVLTDTTVGGTDIGLFLLSATTAGASNGQMVFFSGPPAGGGPSDFFTGTLTGLTNPNSGTFTGLFGGTGQATNGTSRTVTIAGQMSVRAQKAAVGLGTQTLTGTASAQVQAIIITGSTVVAATNTAKTYAVTGWQTSLSSAGNGFAVGSTQ